MRKRFGTHDRMSKYQKSQDTITVIDHWDGKLTRELSEEYPR